MEVVLSVINPRVTSNPSADYRLSTTSKKQCFTWMIDGFTWGNVSILGRTFLFVELHFPLHFDFGKLKKNLQPTVQLFRWAVRLAVTLSRSLQVPNTYQEAQNNDIMH